MTQWVNDELHEILGLSDKYVAQFLVGLARKANSPDDFLRRIRETETVDVNDAVQAFAGTLYHKIPRKAATPTSGAKAAPSASVLKQWELQKKNETYQMLEDTDEDEEETSSSKPKKKKMKKDKKEKKRDEKEERKEKLERNVRRKNKDEESSSEDETTVKRRTHDERSGKWGKDEDEEEEEFEKEERERLEDLEERDAFAQRARDREKGRIGGMTGSCSSECCV